METLNLYQKIQAVSNDVKAVDKNMTVKVTQTSSYKAVSDFDVIIAVKEAEAKHGVLSIPIKQELIKSEIINVPNKSPLFVDIVKMTVRFLNVENPTEFIEIESFGRGFDYGDKGFGKASTYARKYALLNAYKIATGEDPDKNPSSEEIQSDQNVSSPKKNNVTLKKEHFSSPELMKWLYEAEKSYIKNGSRFSLYGIIDLHYNNTDQDKAEIGKYYEQYKINNGLR